MAKTRPLRRFPRIQSEHPVKAKVLAAVPLEEYSTTKAIGLGGCSFGSRHSFGRHAIVELQIPLAGGVLRADGRVAYEIEKSDTEYEIGVEFLRVEPGHLERIKALFAGPGDSS